MNRAAITPVSYWTTIKAWVMMARIPFLLVGILPFCLGGILAWRFSGMFNWPVFLWGVLAVILIMFSTYLAGEYYDLEGDILSARMERNTFSGGTQALVRGMVPVYHAKIGSYVTILLAGFIGLLLQIHYNTGPWTIPFGCAGMVSGFFYSTEPIRWVKRGAGEILIGFSYGWLPVAVSFYLQTNGLIPLVHWMSLPIGLTIFNVILMNEFPDYPADIMTGKTNLVVRFGKKISSYLYCFVCIGALLLYPVAIQAALHPYTLLLCLPVAGLSLMAASWMIMERYTDKADLEKMCSITILINIFYSISFILGLLIWAI